MDDSLRFIEQLKQFYTTKFGKVPPLISLGYSLGGATSLGIWRLQHELFKAQIFFVPHFGLAESVFVPALV